MEIETYEVQEVDEQTVDQADECAALIEQLGLKGQQRFVAKADDTTPGAFPYRKMTAEERNIYMMILPQRTKLTDFSDGLIPLRVLQVAAHASQLQTGTLYVWHPSSADIKDPLLTLRIGSDYGAQEWFMLARWGEVLDNLETLRAKAREIWIAKTRAAVETVRAQADRDLSMLAVKVEEYLVGGDVSMPHFYGWS